MKTCPFPHRWLLPLFAGLTYSIGLVPSGQTAPGGSATGATVGSTGYTTAGGVSSGHGGGTTAAHPSGGRAGGGSFSPAGNSSFRGISPGYPASPGFARPQTGTTFSPSAASGGSAAGVRPSYAGSGRPGHGSFPIQVAARPGYISGSGAPSHNAWTDAHTSRILPSARAGRYGYGGAYDAGQAYLQNRLTSGQHLYQGPASDGWHARNQNDSSQPLRNSGWRGHRRYGPYFYSGLYYPYFFGGFYPGYDGYTESGYGASLSADDTNQTTGTVDGTVPYDIPAESRGSYRDRNEQPQADQQYDAGPGLPFDPPARVGPENPAAAESRPAAETGPDSLVEAVQSELARRGYFGGKVDATYDEPTKAALRRFQMDRQLAVTGRINEATLHALQLD